MLTKITLPNFGEIEFDSALVLDSWAEGECPDYNNCNPPYEGESPDEENFLTIEKDGKKILIFSQSHPAAICMYIDELFIDLDCVYDCQNIMWSYAGMPYGTAEIGYDSIDQMPSFCQDILNVFIKSGIVFCVNGSPTGKYYAIPICDDYYPSSQSIYRHRDTKLWANIIPKVIKACENWLTPKIIEEITEYAASPDIVGYGFFWYDSSLLLTIAEKSTWAQNLLNNTINSFMLDNKISVYNITAKVKYVNEQCILTPVPHEYICTKLLPSKNTAFNSLFAERNTITLKEWLKIAKSAIMPDDLDPIDLCSYLKYPYRSYNRKFDHETLELNIFKYSFESGKAKSEAIMTFSDFSIVKQTFKSPVIWFDVF